MLIKILFLLLSWQVWNCNCAPERYFVQLICKSSIYRIAHSLSSQLVHWRKACFLLLRMNENWINKFTKKDVYDFKCCHQAGFHLQGYSRWQSLADLSWPWKNLGLVDLLSTGMGDYQKARLESWKLLMEAVIANHSHKTTKKQELAWESTDN